MSDQKADKPGYEPVRGEHQEDITSQGTDQTGYDRYLVERSVWLPSLCSDQQDENHGKWFEQVDVIPWAVIFSANV